MGPEKRLKSSRSLHGNWFTFYLQKFWSSPSPIMSPGSRIQEAFGWVRATRSGLTRGSSDNSLSLSPRVCVFLSAFSLSPFLRPSLCLSISLPACLSLCFSFCLSQSLSPSLSVSLSVYLNLSPPLSVFLFLFISISLPLSVFLSLSISLLFLSLFMFLCFFTFLSQAWSISLSKCSVCYSGWSLRPCTCTRRVSTLTPYLL